MHRRLWHGSPKDPLAEMRSDGKLHIVIIQGDKFVSEQLTASNDFENDAPQMMDAAAVCLWRRESAKDKENK